MTLPGLLIEYLINGILALIWIYPLLNKYGITDKIEVLNKSWALLFLVVFYLIGMLIDFLAWKITRPVKKQIRKSIEKKYNLDIEDVSGRTHLRQAKFGIYAPEIAKESAMRNSRDRIARGTIVNSMIGTITYFIIAPNIITLIIGIAIITISCLMWKGFEKISYGYEIKAEQVVDEKIKGRGKES